jgi:CelD/BcsL family acetyltransferase involved in cellulose biosynthesis
MPGRILTVDQVRTAAELDRLSTEWRGLFHRIGCRTPFLSVDWMIAWWNHWGAGHRLWVVTVRNETGRLVGVAPFYLRRSRFGILGSRVLCFLAGRNVGSDHLNVLVEPAYEEPAIEAIVELVVGHRDEWDFLELADSEEASPTLCRLSQQLQARSMTRLVTRSIDCPFTPLPATFEEYLAGLGSNLRYNVRRRWRALEREGVKFINYQGGNELYVRFCDLVHLHRLRFLDQDRVSSFLVPKVQAFHAEALQRMAAAGLARLFTLEIGSHTIAALYGFSTGKTFSFYQSGMDPAWARLSVGLVLMGCSIREAIRHGHDTFDFLRGDEAYKFQWATQSRRAVTVCFFDRRIRSRWVRWQFRILDRLASAKRVVRRSVTEKFADEEQAT